MEVLVVTLDNPIEFTEIIEKMLNERWEMIGYSIALADNRLIHSAVMQRARRGVVDVSKKRA